MIRPEGLRQTVERSLAVRLHVVLAGKAAVVGWVPVLAGNHRFTAALRFTDQHIGDINRAVAIGNRQGAARTEIVL